MAGDSSSDEGITRLVLILLGVAVVGALVSQAPISDDMNLWEKAKAVVSSAINQDGDDAASEDGTAPAEGVADENAGEQADDGTAGEGADAGEEESLGDKLGFSLPDLGGSEEK